MPEDSLPTRTEVHKARKAQLQEWCRQFGLDEEGTVPELKKRILEHLESLEGEEIEEEVEEVEEVEEEVYVAKPKPVLDDETRRFLELRRMMQRKRPAFRRQEWFRYKRLGEKWRRPRGHHSKLRRRLRHRGSMPSSGFRGPTEARGLHPSGFQEVTVHRPEDLDGLDPRTHAARIAHGVGTKKRIEIQDRADELGIRILNRVVE